MHPHQKLISELQKGNKQALSGLYDAYSSALYGIIIRICKNEAAAQDVLQETFIKIWKNATSYHPEKGAFYTWAYRIARNTSLNYIRNQKKLIQNEDLSVYTHIEDTQPPEPDTISLNGSLKKLALHHQEAIRLVYFEGFTHREAHQEMKVPLGTFKSYIQQALKKLREEFPTAIGIGFLLIDMMIWKHI